MVFFPIKRIETEVDTIALNRGCVHRLPAMIVRRYSIIGRLDGSTLNIDETVKGETTNPPTANHRFHNGIRVPIHWLE